MKFVKTVNLSRVQFETYCNFDLFFIFHGSVYFPKCKDKIVKINYTYN